MPSAYRTLGQDPGDADLLSLGLDGDRRPASCVLAPEAWAKWRRTQARTPWAQTRLREVVLHTGDTLHASATVLDLPAVLDGQPVMVFSVSHLTAHDGEPAESAQRLMDAVIDEATQAGAAAVLLAAVAGDGWTDPLGFVDATPPTVALRVLAGRRPGAPMLSVRAGEVTDLPQLVDMADSMPPVRFRLQRDLPFIAHTVAVARLRAGLQPSGQERLEFFVTEEGTRAAAYVVLRIRSDGWRLEQCGDRDPSGARVGAILQALVARDPSAVGPAIHGWLPSGWLPPQLDATPCAPAPCRTLVRLLGAAASRPPLAPRDTIMWMADLLQAV